ncbi:SAM-dependent methyltransferase [Actinomadura roseirufa]|uniref:SAM-dependent methyltransferase n=1 Tax=Actinomadura roseirufa TaxID=2094049 RepID=UPI001041A685|nr:SAM-dependent methyltransferase [Actinomadura roseirufa]
MNDALGDDVGDDRPSSARVWNYYLGGKDNYAVDREAAHAVMAHFPAMGRVALESRRFLGRAVTYLVEKGVDQFLDIGTGLPTIENTHEIAQRLDPAARIVYVDNDPLVLSHARALLTSTPTGACDYLDADLRDPGDVLGRAARTLDFGRPVALMLVAVVHHLVDDAEAAAVVAELAGALAPGSHMALVHATADFHGRSVADGIRSFNDADGTPLCTRTRAQVSAFFDGMDLVDPGLVSTSRWRGDPDGDDREVPQWAGVAGVRGR